MANTSEHYLLIVNQERRQIEIPDTLVQLAWHKHGFATFEQVGNAIETLPEMLTLIRELLAVCEAIRALLPEETP